MDWKEEKKEEGIKEEEKKEEEKKEEIYPAERNFGNYNRNKEDITKETQLTKGHATDLSQSGQPRAMPANVLSWANGIVNIDGLKKLAGWNEKYSIKGKTLMETVDALDAFHDNMNKVIELSNLEEWIAVGRQSYENLLQKVTHYVARARKTGAWVHIHRKEEKEVLPAMGTLLIKLYSLGNVFDYLENLSYDYLMKNHLDKASLGAIIASREALSVQGNVPSKQIYDSSFFVDNTAYQMNKRKTSGEEAAIDKRKELYGRRLPVLQGSETKAFVQELEVIASMVEDLELKSKTSLEREDIKIDFIDLTKMIHIISKNPFLLTSSDKQVKEEYSKDEKLMRAFRLEDLQQAKEYYEKTKGKTVEEALKAIDKLRQESAETAGENSTEKSGKLSLVLIDDKQNRVLRTSKDEGGITKQRDKNNFNYDEAMSRLSEITGLGSIAGARTTYFKDKGGTLQYGTNMEKAQGQAGTTMLFGFGNKEVDDQMVGKYHNIFGHENQEELTKNANLIISSFKLQILDYISYHRDRHENNFFIDMEAKDLTNAFQGIDNDNVFGKGTSEDKKQRLVSYEQHAKAGYEGMKFSGIMKPYATNTSTLQGFACIPEQTYEQIKKLNVKQIEEAMRPYLDRAARFALIRRIISLKAYVEEKAKKVDIYKSDGMDEFKKETIGVILKTFMDVKDVDNISGGYDLNNKAWVAPGILVRMLMKHYFQMGNKGNSQFPYKKNGLTEDDYFSSDNYYMRNKQLWKVLDAMLKEVGMSREEFWDKSLERRSEAERAAMQKNRDYYELSRQEFIDGTSRFFMTFQRIKIKEGLEKKERTKQVLEEFLKTLSPK